jgi:hypothetical protein
MPKRKKNNRTKRSENERKKFQKNQEQRFARKNTLGTVNAPPEWKPLNKTNRIIICSNDNLDVAMQIAATNETNIMDMSGKRGDGKQVFFTSTDNPEVSIVILPTKEACYPMKGIFEEIMREHPNQIKKQQVIIA